MTTELLQGQGVMAYHAPPPRSVRILPYPLDRLAKFRRSDARLITSLHRLSREGSVFWRDWCCLDLGLEREGTVQLTDLSRRSVLALRNEWRTLPALLLEKRGSGRILLVIDAMLVAELCARLLRTSEWALAPPLTPTELGVLWFGVASLVSRVGCITGWRIVESKAPIKRFLRAPPVGDASSERLVVSMKVSLGLRSGPVWLACEDSTRLTFSGPESSHPIRVGRLGDYRIDLSLMVANLTLAHDLVAELTSGDVLVGEACPRSLVGNKGHLVTENGSFPVLIEHRSVVVLGRHAEGVIMEPQHQGEGLAEGLPVAIVVEAARLTVSLAQLASLREGDLLDLAEPLNAAVTLRAGELVIAKGELVDIDGDAGIRLTEVYE